MAKKQNPSSKEKQFKFTRKPLFNIHYYESDPLFTAKLHPSEPIFLTGTGTGNVKCYRYDISKLKEIYEDQDKFPYDISNDKTDDFDDNSIIVNWSTKRHKKSCRDLCFDLPSGGSKIHSIGSEGVIKSADLETGKVIAKFVAEEGSASYTKCISTPNKNFLLVGDENGNLMCHDTREKHLKLAFSPFKRLHSAEGINSINYCWPKSDYKIITTGSTTLCELDLRKPENPLHTSEDQEDEILSGCWLDQEKQDTFICGMGDGIVTTWKPSMNDWNDQISRIRVNKNETIESLISSMDSDSRFVYSGSSNGHIAKIDIKGGKVVERFLQYDPEDEKKVDEVLGLDLDHDYRLCSYGTEGFKIWENENEYNENGANSDSDSDNDNDDSDDASDTDDSFSGFNSSDDSDEEVEEGAQATGEKLSEDEQESEEESEEEKEEPKPTVRKRSLADSLKRRMESAPVSDSKKVKTNELIEGENSDVGEEVPDSDDETDINATPAQTVELKDIKDKILAQISNPDAFSTNKKKGKKKEKRGQLAANHGIHKFDDL